MKTDPNPVMHIQTMKKENIVFLADLKYQVLLDILSLERSLPQSFNKSMITR